MCVEQEQGGRRRWQRAGANLSLVAGLLMWSFAREAGHARPWLDAVTGLLMGMSIGMNLMLVIKVRRCRAAAPDL
ncbi:MAG TPA: hypothetical protein VMU48_21595 [Terracidiphilus sp.]|nr:hypothetical protein [Terracidiphilus sp.]